MIVINNNIEQHNLAFLYCPIGQYIGQIHNNLALLDVRRQIKEKGVGGYRIDWYVEKDGKVELMDVIKITANGKMDRNPNGFFDTFTNLLIDLVF